MGALCLTRKSFPELLFIICRELLSSYIVPVLTGEELVLLLVVGIHNAVYDECVSLGITIACPAEGIEPKLLRMLEDDVFVQCVVSTRGASFSKRPPFKDGATCLPS